MAGDARFAKLAPLYPAFESFLNALEDTGCKVRRWGIGRAGAQCPAHDDMKPSLGITAARGGRVLVNCFAGCTESKILDALGLTSNAHRPQRCDHDRIPEQCSICRGYGYGQDNGQPSIVCPAGLDGSHISTCLRASCWCLALPTDQQLNTRCCARCLYQSPAGVAPLLAKRASLVS
jgi:hypothetical protein